MKDDLRTRRKALSEDDGAREQFRLARLQTFNWGTFAGLFDFPIAAAGFLFVGPSGSGKSTLLDAHAALLTPPRWIDFNVAAREAERHGRDRSLATYVRGAWAQQTGDSGEYVAQFLRPGTTWSAIAETFRSEAGRVVVLAQVFWIRGIGNASGDVKRLFLVLERAFDLRELEFFAASDFDVRKFKAGLPDAWVRDEFSAYQERFRRLLGIDSERALRLLHKTQSAKNLGDLNTFLRDFMLDTPETFLVADRLVAEFGELNAAHQAVVSARQQIETLAPARAEHESHVAAQVGRTELRAIGLAVDRYREARRRRLLEERIAQLQAGVAAAEQEARQLAEKQEYEFARLRDLQDRRHGMGGGVLEQLAQQVEEAEREKGDRLRKRAVALAACKTMDWVLPQEPGPFAALIEQARARVLEASTQGEALEVRRDALKDSQRNLSERFVTTRREVEAMERQRSNLPARMLDARAALAQAIGVPDERLPFVGELLEVRADEAAWQGAIERVLRGFALSLLVEDGHYHAVTAWLNDRHLGERIVYLRVTPDTVAGAAAAPAASDALARKLAVAPGPYADWLRAELRNRFDYACVGSVAAFRAAVRAVTLQGQVKHGHSRHEKDDRHRVDDRGRWVLGFDNQAKLALFRREAQALAGELESVRGALEASRTEGERQREQWLAAQALANLTWNDIDTATVFARVTSLATRIRAEQEARPDLKALDVEIERQTGRHKRAADARVHADGAVLARRTDLDRTVTRLRAMPIEADAAPLTVVQSGALDERYARVGRDITLESIDQVTTQVVRAMADEERVLVEEAGRLQQSIERRFADFIRGWPAEAGGLDAVIASAGDFFQKLERLEIDGLPRHEARFLQLLREQSDQNLTLLTARLDQERKSILERLGVVNESLRSARFNPGTHLVIDRFDRSLDEVRAFRQTLKEALARSLTDEPASAERRFAAINALVTRLSSQEPADRYWRSLVLDVRQHVEFVARELDEAGIEVEVYRSGAGKSGGQRQKLATTCLAAALRYQLGGPDRAVPAFATVVMDEAFDKADAEFTSIAMNIFRTFGFQMVVATPLKSVMTLEPFIGGACFIHIRDRRSSAALMIEYDEEAQRLRLPAGDHGDTEAAGRA